jgi:hypothetical protein
LSFNNDGPLGTFFRYIGDTGTYIARYDDLFNGKDEKIDVSQVDVSDERHRAAGPRVLRRHPRRPRAQRQRAQVLPCYQVLHDLRACRGPGDGVKVRVIDGRPATIKATCEAACAPAAPT